jgi:hypothetical protein
MGETTISRLRSHAGWIAGVLTTFLATGLGTATPARAIAIATPRPMAPTPLS